MVSKSIFLLFVAIGTGVVLIPATSCTANLWDVDVVGNSCGEGKPALSLLQTRSMADQAGEGARFNQAHWQKKAEADERQAVHAKLAVTTLLEAVLLGAAEAKPKHADVSHDSSRLRFYVHNLSMQFDPELLVAKHPEYAETQWANDLNMIRNIKGTMATQDPGRADFFLVPFLAKCYLNYEAVYNLTKMEQDFGILMKELNATKAWKRWPHRHIFFFASGVGPTLITSWQKIRSAIFVLPEGDRSAGFYDSSKDIIIPGVNTKTLGKKNTRELHRPRQLLASFRGQIGREEKHDPSGHLINCRNLLRQSLLTAAEGRQDVSINGTYLSGHAYTDEMASSTFCIIPRGLTPWTSRLFDAMALDCIPVVLSNAIVFPFERFMDWSTFTIKLPEAWAPRLWTLLDSIPRRKVRDLQVRVREAAHNLAGNEVIGSAISELAMLRHGGVDSANYTTNTVNTFWMPGRGIFKLKGNEARQVGPSYSAGGVAYPDASELYVPDEAFKKLAGNLWEEDNCVAS